MIAFLVRLSRSNELRRARVSTVAVLVGFVLVATALAVAVRFAVRPGAETGSSSDPWLVALGPAILVVIVGVLLALAASGRWQRERGIRALEPAADVLSVVLTNRIEQFLADVHSPTDAAAWLPLSDSITLTVSPAGVGLWLGQPRPLRAHAIPWREVSSVSVGGFGGYPCLVVEFRDSADPLELVVLGRGFGIRSRPLDLVAAEFEEYRLSAV